VKQPCLRGGFLLLLVLLLSATAATAGSDLAADLRTFAREEPGTVAAIGARIRLNETGGVDEWLLAWLVGEDHLSLGIGHFIWYPAGRAGPFRESFVDFLVFLDQREHPAPLWPTPETPCPWPTREAFLAAAADPRLARLRALIEDTVEAQTAFLIDRLATSIPALLDAVPADERPTIEGRLQALMRPSGEIDPNGVYALVDYVNFKGEGLAPAERHQGEGWGLLQVLQGMDDGVGDTGVATGDGPAGADELCAVETGNTLDANGRRLGAFCRSATRVLERRVALSPPERFEARWLNNWRARVATYTRGLDG
jgi:hypothetical protein